MDESIERLAHDVGGSFSSRAKRFTWAARYAKWLLVTCSALATAAHFDSEDPVVRHAGIALSVIILLSGGLILFLDQDSSEELEIARSALEKVRELKRRLDATLSSIEELERPQRMANELYLSNRAMREVLEKSLFERKFDTGNIIDLFLDTCRRSLIVACGFTTDQHYTIGVYKAKNPTENGKPATLHCISQIRSVTCELTNARVWDSGTGVVGMAFSSASEVIVPDMSAKELGSAFLSPKAKKEDEKLYRSMAAVPIIPEGNTIPWGVVIATVDRPNHFSTDRDGVKPAEVVRALAGMVSLAISTRSIVESTIAVGASSTSRRR